MRYILRRKKPVTESWPTLPGVFIADTTERARQALAIIEKQPIAGVDVESYDCNPAKESPVHIAKPISIQFSGGRGPRIFVPLWSGIGEKVDPLGRLDLLKVFKPWLTHKKRQKVYHNGKYDMHVLANVMDGEPPDGLLGDTLVMDYLYANGEMLHGLKECLRRYSRDGGIDVSPYETDDFLDYSETFRVPKIGKKGNELKTTWVPPLTEVVKTRDGVEKLVDYSVKDPFGTVKLYEFLKAKLSETPWIESKARERSYFEYYEMFEVPYTLCLWEVEREGCPINVPYVEERLGFVNEDIGYVEKEFNKECVKLGIPSSYLETFNMLSNPQIGQLFARLGTPLPATEKGNAQTDGEALSGIKGRAKPIAELILKRRKLDKLQGTYLSSWIECARKYKGRIHTTLKQTGTATMRLSSAAPNLQNVVKPGEKDPYELRKAFISPNDEEALADIDLNQIEVRLTAHFTGDEALITMLRNGYDQHLLTMGMVFDDAKEIIQGRACDDKMKAKVKEALGDVHYEDERRKAKVVNFGVIYGMGEMGYAAKAGCSPGEAKIALENYFKGYPGLKKGIDRTKDEAREHGHIRTLLRRYCVITGIHSSQGGIRGHAERQAFNFKIQGSARDMIMMAMVLCWKCPRLRELKVKMILQIHDELIFLMPKSSVEEAKPLIEEYVAHPYRCMERVMGLKMKDLIVDTPADLGVAFDWLTAKTNGDKKKPFDPKSKNPYLDTVDVGSTLTKEDLERQEEESHARKSNTDRKKSPHYRDHGSTDRTRRRLLREERA